MFRTAIVTLLLSSFIAAQEPAKPASPASPSAPTLENRPEDQSAALPPDAAVITIKNLCADGSTAPTCSTVVTKGNFEKLLSSVLPTGTKLPPGSKQQIARQYASLLLMSSVAKKNGVSENDPDVKARVQLAVDSALAQTYDRHLHDQSTPSQAEIEKYYSQNPKEFEEVTLQRLYIPKATPSKEKPVDATAEKAAADKLRDRAAAGEDIDKLQKEAFTAAGEAGTSPPTVIGPRRRGQGLPPDQEAAVFALPQGGVTPALDNPAGWFVYKVTAKRTVPLAEVKDEISSKLQQQKYTDAREAVVKSVDTELNQGYFGSAQPEEMPGMPPGMHMQRMPAQQGGKQTPPSKPPQH